MGRVKIVSASAGSGKTYNLAYEYVRTVVNNPDDYRHTLAVTFTNKATDEMKQRILLQLNSLAKGSNPDFAERLQNDLNLTDKAIRQRAEEARNYILHDYTNFSVMTIDKFFQRILRSFIKELGIDINFNLELQTDTLLSRAADRLIEDLPTDPTLRKWLMDYMGENIEAGTSWEIKSHLVTIGAELFKEQAGRAALSPNDKSRLQAMAFRLRKKADDAIDDYAREAQSFIKLMNDNALLDTDFIYGKNGVAGFVQKAASGSLEEGKIRVSDALNKGIWCKNNTPKAAIIGSLATQFGDILRRMQPLLSRAQKLNATAKIIGGGYRSFGLLADLHDRMKAICSEEEIVPMAEIGGIIASLVENNDAPFIYEKSGNRYTHYMIDEAQDTSRRQWNNFVPLLRNALAQSDDEPVMVVGDVKQSIYRWRGGDWRLLSEGVAASFPNSRKVALRDNYRSRRRVVEFNNDLIKKCNNSFEISLKASLDKGLADNLLSPELHNRLGEMVGEAYIDYLQNPADKRELGYVTFESYPKDAVHPVIARTEDLQARGYRPSDIAILVRENKEATEIASLLLEYKRLNPESPYSFDVITQEALTVSSSEAVRFVVAAMSIAINPNDSIGRAIYNCYLGRMPDCELPADESAQLTEIAFRTPEEAFEEIVVAHSLDQLSEEIPYLQALHQQILDFCKSQIADTSLFLKYWDEKGSTKSIPMPPSGNAITIMTIHKAKGLGFRTVILPYCSWALYPTQRNVVWASPSEEYKQTKIDPFPVHFNDDMSKSIFSKDYYQERTMGMIDSLNELYVAVTRAAEELHIMMPDSAPKATNSIGQIVEQAIGAMEGGEIVGTVKQFGTAAEAVGRTVTETSKSTFGTFRPSEKVAVRFDHERYNEDGNYPLSPRQSGILMHRAMERACSREDIATTIDRMAADAVLSPDEAAALRGSIDRAFENSIVAEWFDGHWQKIKNENEIISEGHTFRPDRVMIDGGRAVVVDYKFGLPSPRHAEQVGQYLNLLRQMGYSNPEGYVWYIAAERVERV